MGFSCSDILVEWFSFNDVLRPGIARNTLFLSSPGPGFSKLTMSLVKVSLKFQTLISEICQYFLLKKCEKLLHCKSFSHFSTKKFSVFDYKAVKHLTS